MKRFLCLFTVWFVGFCFFVLQFCSQLNLAPALPKLLIICLVATPALILLSQKCSEGKTLLFLLLFSFSLRLVCPLGEGGSSFVVFRDPIYTFQVTKIYLEQGRWAWGLETLPATHLVSCPALNLLSVLVSEVTGLEVFTVCRFFPAFIPTLVIILLLFYALKRLIGSHNAMLACFIFSLCYKFNTFNNLYIQESLGIVFFVMTFYALILRERKGAYIVVFIVAVSTLVWTHFFYGYVFLLTIAIALLASKLYVGAKSSSNVVNTGDFLSTIVLFFGWVTFVATQPFISSYQMSSNYLMELTSIIQRPWATRSIPAPTGILLSPLEMLIAYVGILIPVLLGLFTCFDLFVRQRRTSNYSVAWLRIFGLISFILGATVLIGLRAFVKTPDMAYRFITLFYIFLSALSALSLGIIQSRLERISFKKRGIGTIHHLFTRGIFVLFLIIPVLSTGLLIPSFLDNKSVVLNDRDVALCSSWVSAYADKSVAIVGETILAEPVAAYSRMDFWWEHGRARLDNQTITDVIYYGGNMGALVNFLQQNNGKILFLVNKHFIDHEHFRLRIDTQTRIPSIGATNFAFRTINQLPFLNKIYEGESPSVYMVTKGE